jgi:hypothetical protein
MLERMKQAAAERLKDAADQAREQAGQAAVATQKAAAIGAAKASVVVKAQARAGAGQAQRAASRGADRAVVTLKDPATKEKARKAVADAGRGVKSALDKLNPSLLASIVIKATSLQEQANASLRETGSLYRISGIEIGAAFPPSISFQIARIADLDPAIAGALDEEVDPGTDLAADFGADLGVGPDVPPTA